MYAASRRGRQARLPSTLLALIPTAFGSPHLAAQAAPGDSVRVLEYTTDEGTWISLDVSPVDGTLVFELVGDVYTLDAGGGQARPLLTGPAFQSQPRWSPDGARIAFISDGTGSDNVWVATADGRDPRALSTLPRSLVLSPAWSADGRAVFATVVDAYGARTAALWRWDVATGEGAPLVENANGPPQPLVSSPAPGPYGAHAAPDGEWLWYTAVTPRPYGSRNGASTRILRRHLGSGREEPVALEGISPMKPVLSRDGRWLVYGAVQDGRTGLRLRDLQRARERWLAYPVDRNALESRASRDVLPDLAFTPDGAAVMAAYGGRIHRLPVDGSASEVVPFLAQVRVETRPAPDVRVRLPDGPVRARRVDQVAVGPDGRLVFSALGRIWVAGRAGERPERLTRSERPREFMPAVSPDGRQVAFVTWGAEGGHLWVTRRDGRGAPQAVGGGPALWVDPAWTPDGRALVALRAPVGSARAAPELVPPDAEVVWVDVDNGAGAAPPSFRVIAPAGTLRRPHFGPDPQRVMLTSPSDGLVSFALTGGDRRVHATLARGQGLGFAGVVRELLLSPDGTRVAARVGERVHVLPFPERGPGDDAAPAELDAQGSDAASDADAPQTFTWGGDGSLVWVHGRTVERVDDARVHGDALVPRSVQVDVRLPRVGGRGTVVLRGARAITMRGYEIVPDADIVITDDRIAALGPRGSVPVPAGARILDVTGRTIMPGIIDVHAHWSVGRGALSGEILEPESPQAYANLAFGTTTIRDPQSSADIFGYADLIEAGAAAGPRVLSTGPGVFLDRDFQSLDDTRALLERYRDDHGTWMIKSYLVGNRQQRQWMAEASRTLGMLTTTEGGSDTKMDLTHAIDGFAGNEHAFPDAPIHEDLVQLVARSGIAYTPTLLVSFGGALPIYRLQAEERPHLNARLAPWFPPGELWQNTSTRLLWFPPEDYYDADVARGAADILEAGGRVALGGHGEMQGLQNHWEMRLLEAGGMRPHDVLRVATILGASALGLTDDLGSLEPGKKADLLVLEADPLTGVRNAEQIAWVMKDGVLRDARTLDALWPVVEPLPTPWWRAPISTASTRNDPTAAESVSGRPAIPEPAIDAVVEADMAALRVPGMAVAVLDGDAVRIAKGYGLANLEHQVRVTPQTMFQSGSLAKQLTAAGVLVLVEEGRMQLDAPLSTYLPRTPVAWSGVTIRHLLSHTSGVPDYTSEGFDYRRDYTEDDIQTMAFAMALEFAPGTRWNYSNTGYVLLGIAIGQVTGRPYWEYLRERIFDPAGMPTVRVISEAAVVPHRASGYALDADGEWVHQTWVSPTLNTTADGSMLFSLEDLIAWARTVRERRVLSEESWDAMLAPTRLNSGNTHPYGFAWFLGSVNGQPIQEHAGSWQGFQTQLIRYPERDLTIVVLANQRSARPSDTSRRIAAVIDPTLEETEPTTPIADRDPEVTALLRRVLEKTARGELGSADFEFMRQTVVPRMSAAYAALLRDRGAIEAIDLLATGTEGDDRTFVYRVRYPEGTVQASIKVGPGGGLTGLLLRPVG